MTDFYVLRRHESKATPLQMILVWGFGALFGLAVVFFVLYGVWHALVVFGLKLEGHLP